MMQRIWFILAGLLASGMLAGCGASKPRRHLSSAPKGSTPTAISPPTTSGAAPQIGAPTPSKVTCTRTLKPGADVNSALSSASPGAVVCLDPGGWSAITLTGIAPASPGVTLAATPGQTVVVPGITVSGSNTRNLTVEGFNITVPGNTTDAQGGLAADGIQLLCAISGGVTLEYNTIEDQPAGDGIYVYANNCGRNTTETAVTIAYNQIDHVETALEIDGGITEESNFTFSHNVIGPYIQYGGYGHYIQVQGISGLTVASNAFEGPPDPRYNDCASTGAASHLNVLHADTGQRDVMFDANILWHTQACGDSVLVQDKPMDNIEVNNNLDVEDPACNNDTANGCQTVPFFVIAPHGLTFENNTSVNASRGIVLGKSESPSYTDPNTMTAKNNIVAPTSGESGGSNYGTWDCTSSCNTQDNVSADATANSLLGGAGNVVNWKASWRNTSWTPVSGPGYKPPPSGYYQPTGLAISNAGYQGHIGP